MDPVDDPLIRASGWRSPSTDGRMSGWHLPRTDKSFRVRLRWPVAVAAAVEQAAERLPCQPRGAMCYFTSLLLRCGHCSCMNNVHPWRHPLSTCKSVIAAAMISIAACLSGYIRHPDAQGSGCAKSECLKSPHPLEALGTSQGRG